MPPGVQLLTLCSKHVNHQSPPLCELQGQGHILHPEHSGLSQ